MNTRTTISTVFGFEIRYYANGQYDVAEVAGTGLSQGFATYDEAVQWAAEQRAAQRILDVTRRNNEPSALRSSFA